MTCIVNLQFDVWSISKDKPNLDYIYVIHLVPNNTQTMHTLDSKVSTLVEFTHIKFSEYCSPLTNPKCLY